jgi:hypothetical protein
VDCREPVVIIFLDLAGEHAASNIEFISEKCCVNNRMKLEKWSSTTRAENAIGIIIRKVFADALELSQ